MVKAVLHFDGSGSGSGGYVIYVGDRTLSAGFDFGGVTCNQAEYYALICGLKRLVYEYDPAEIDLVVRGDSKLVVNQVAGKWRVKERHLLAPVLECRKLLKRFRSHVLEWVPRRRNRDADRAGRGRESVEGAFPWVRMSVSEVQDGIAVSFPFEAPLIPALKRRFRGAVWDPAAKRWLLPGADRKAVEEWCRFIGAKVE